MTTEIRKKLTCLCSSKDLIQKQDFGCTMAPWQPLLALIESHGLSWRANWLCLKISSLRWKCTRKDYTKHRQTEMQTLIKNIWSKSKRTKQTQETPVATTGDSSLWRVASSICMTLTLTKLLTKNTVRATPQLSWPPSQLLPPRPPSLASEQARLSQPRSLLEVLISSPYTPPPNQQQHLRVV